VIRFVATVLAASALCGCEATFAPAHSGPMVDGRGASDELFLLASSTTGVWTRPLLPGVTYRVVIEGTASFWHAEHWSSVCAGTPAAHPQLPSPGATGPVGIDAEWTWSWPSSSSLCRNGVPDGPVPWPQRRLLIQDGSGAPPQRLPPPLESGMTWNHAYTYSLTGAGRPVVFFVDDAPLDDNYGEFRILLFPTS